MTRISRVRINVDRLSGASIWCELFVGNITPIHVYIKTNIHIEIEYKFA